MNTYLDRKSVLDAIASVLESTKNQIIDSHLAAGQKASGNAAESFKVIVDYEGGEVALVGAAYTGVLENGRRGGKVPYDMEEILVRWAKAKGIQFKDEKDMWRFANAVKWNIIRFGTRLHVAGGRKDIYTDKLEAAKREIAKVATPFFIKEIQKLIQ